MSNELIGFDYNCCRECSNNPKNNPNASGVCFCTLPYFETQRTVPSQQEFWNDKGTALPSNISSGFPAWSFDTDGVTLTAEETEVLYTVLVDYVMCKSINELTLTCRGTKLNALLSAISKLRDKTLKARGKENDSEDK